MDEETTNAIGTADNIIVLFEVMNEGGTAPEEIAEAALGLLEGFTEAQLRLMILHIAERLAEWTVR